jgi:4-hydroxybenzoate polyprenyltransferase
MNKYILNRILTFGNLVVSSGIAYSGLMINEGTFNVFKFLFSFLGILLFLALLRIVDDIQDISKDKIAFPNRILLKKNELQMIKKIVWRTIIAFSIVLFLFFWKSAFFYSVALIYFWYQKKSIREPIVKHFLSQGMIIPIAFFASEMGNGVSPSYALVLFGAFSTNEICRKLDPFAHPVILSLIQFYGFSKVYWIVVGQVLISAVGAYFLNAYLILWPAEIGVLYVLSRLFDKPRDFRLAQIAGGISLLLHIWFA